MEKIEDPKEWKKSLTQQFEQDHGVDMVYIDLEVVTDPDLVAWVVSEAKRCYGENVEIVYKKPYTPPRMVQLLHQDGDLIYMSSDENVKMWLEAHPSHERIMVYVPGEDEMMTVEQYLDAKFL